MVLHRLRCITCSEVLRCCEVLHSVVWFYIVLRCITCSEVLQCCEVLHSVVWFYIGYDVLHVVRCYSVVKCYIV